MTHPQRVLITAGAAGIGRGIVDAFLARGARVHVCDVSDDALGALGADLPDVDGQRLDVADAAAVAGWIEQSAGALGGIDVLVNNAGIGGPRAALEHTDETEWRRTLEVNLSGAFFATKAVIPIMKRQTAGVILNISTASVLTGLPGRSAYVASKQGLMGLTKNTAREVGPAGIRCNAILPGLIDNPRGRGLVQAMATQQGTSFAEAEASILQYISLRTWVTPRDVGEMAAFLASDAAGRVTGQFIGVCGGVEWEG